MKIIYVRTKKVVSHDDEGMPLFEDRVQKLQEFGVFDVFCKHIKAHGYKSSEVVGVFHKPKGQKGELYKDEETLLPYKKKLEASKEEKESISGDSLKRELEIEKLKSKQLENRMADMERLMQDLKPKQEDLSELKKRAKDLGIPLTGLKNEESILKKIEEKENEAL